METITIQVDAKVAEAYQQAATQQQQNISLIFNLIAKELLQPTPFRELVQDIRAEAASNGLTEDVLA